MKSIIAHLKEFIRFNSLDKTLNFTVCLKPTASCWTNTIVNKKYRYTNYYSHRILIILHDLKPSVCAAHMGITLQNKGVRKEIQNEN